MKFMKITMYFDTEQKETDEIVDCPWKAHKTTNI